MSGAQPYKIENGPGVLDQIKAIKHYSRHAGKYEQFIEIMEEALRRLQGGPHVWGDPEYRAKTVDAVACRGLIRPVVFRYVIYEQVRGVVLVSVRLYADFE